MGPSTPGIPAAVDDGRDLPARPLPPPGEQRSARFPLTFRQVAANSLAAATAAAVAARLGVAGTVVGTALFSLVATIGTALYERSLQTAREGARRSVKRIMVAPRPGGLRRPAGAAARPRSGRMAGMIVLAVVLVFLGAAATITAVEVIARRPVADLTGGRSGETGTSFLGTSPTRSHRPTPTPTVTTPAPSPDSRPSSAGPSPAPSGSRDATPTASPAPRGPGPPPSTGPRPTPTGDGTGTLRSPAP